jgi:hypothetical protein
VALLTKPTWCHNQPQQKVNLMTTTDWRVAFFRHAFLRHAPRRYALMLAPKDAQRLGQKYMERRGAITDTMIARHLHGTITLAAPAAVAGRAHLLPLDVDAGGIAAIDALIAATQQRDLWAFGQYSVRQGLADEQQRGYVWLPFDTLVDTEQLQALGTQLIAAIRQPGWKIEPHAFHAVTRLPLARHQHTGGFGDLILGEHRIIIDQDPDGALAELYDAYRENSISELPQLIPSPQPATRPVSSYNNKGITIAHYNQTHDVEDLLRFWPTRRRGLYFCPFHPDEQASLSVYTAQGRRYVHCLSRLSDCPLAKHGHNDAFNVYCIGEDLDAKNALRRLNGWE